MHALSTWCRERSPATFVERARALGVEAVALDGTLEVRDLAVLLPALYAAGMAVVAVAAPCPAPPRGRRAPMLGTEDKDERLAAVRAATEAVGLASDHGARAVVLSLGSFGAHAAEKDVLLKFARRQLERETIAALVAERRARSPRALDLCRFGLEPLLDVAGAAGVTLAVQTGARWYDLPSAGELEALLGDFSGAPLAPWHDTAAAHVRRALGFGPGRPAIEVEAAAGAWLTDAAGPRVALPWGTGDVNRTLLDKLPATALRVVHAAPPIGDEELAGALQGTTRS